MNLYQSILILNNCYDTIDYLSQVMVDYKLTLIDPSTADDKTQFHFPALFRSCMVEACSFMEEFQGNFEQLVEPAYKDRVRSIKTAARPAIQKISRWKDLKKIRNELFVHP